MASKVGLAAARLACVLSLAVAVGRSMEVWEIKKYRDKVQSMFQHGYDSYMQHAYPRDELCPLTCSGRDTWGRFSLTLIDSLDTLAVMGNVSEFQRAYSLVISNPSFDINVNVSVFETNIRVVGGLLSAHLLSVRAGVPLAPGWPCQGPLLAMAESLARKLLAAFDTPTGLPYGTINLLYGVPPGEIPITCTACCASFLVEFGTLSRLTGDPVFEDTALRATDAIWQRRTPIGLFGNHIDVQTGKWTAFDFTIGNFVDSFLEYLVKGAALLGHTQLWSRFRELLPGLKMTLFNNWNLWVNMEKGTFTFPEFVALDGYWPGLLSQFGEVRQAMATLSNYISVWQKYGAIPEVFVVIDGMPKKDFTAYHLRPEVAESTWYLFKATGDPLLLEFGRILVDSIDAIARVPCGFATVNNVLTHELTDRMESYFLAETLKYLYLLFDPDNFVSLSPTSSTPLPNMEKHGAQHLTMDPKLTENGCSVGGSGYVFNTEAHPLDVGALRCCHTVNGRHKRQVDTPLGAEPDRREPLPPEHCKARPFHARFEVMGFSL